MSHVSYVPSLIASKHTRHTLAIAILYTTYTRALTFGKFISHITHTLRFVFFCTDLNRTSSQKGFYAAYSQGIYLICCVVGADQSTHGWGGE